MNKTLPMLFLAVSIASLPAIGRAGDDEKVIRLGMIGLDTSHVIAFTSYLNNPKNNTGCKVVAAFPGGSPDFKASADRVDKFTAEMRDKHGVEMVDSIAALRPEGRWHHAGKRGRATAPGTGEDRDQGGQAAVGR